MLMPKRQKHRKVRKGRIRGVASTGHYIAFGDYALQAQGMVDPIEERQPVLDHDGLFLGPKALVGDLSFDDACAAGSRRPMAVELEDLPGLGLERVLVGARPKRGTQSGGDARLPGHDGCAGIAAGNTQRFHRQIG